MSREIKFRGIDRETGKFIYGDYIQLVLGGNIHRYIKPLDDKRREIIYETLGQFVTTINEIHSLFEGDTVKVEIDGYPKEGSIKWEHTSYVLSGYGYLSRVFNKGCTLEIIGNIHQIKELIK